MAENVIITAGSGRNVNAIDSIVNQIATNDSLVDLEPNTFYELEDSSLQTLNLPLVSKEGDLIGISGVATGLFKIVQRAGEQILYGTTATTIGTFGTFESTQINDVVYLRRLASPTLWLAYATQGNFLVDAAGAATLNNAINNTGGDIFARTARDSSSLLSPVADRGYILTRSSLQQIFVPSTASTGDTYLFQGNGTGLFRLDQSGSQQIFFGDQETIAGFAGYVESTHPKDGLYLMCTNAPNEFTVLPSSTGNFNMNTAGGIVSQNAVNNAGGGGGARSYGQIHKTPGALDTQFIGLIWERWQTGTFFAGLLADFVWDDPTNTTRLIYTGVDTKPFNIRYEMGSADGSATRITGGIYLNGALIDDSQFFIRNGSTAVAMSSIGTAKVNLSTNDYIEPWLIASSGASWTVEFLKLEVNEV
jgi:hypothetical protein